MQTLFSVTVPEVCHEAAGTQPAQPSNGLGAECSAAKTTGNILTPPAQGATQASPCLMQACPKGEPACEVHGSVDESMGQPAEMQPPCTTHISGSGRSNHILLAIVDGDGSASFMRLFSHIQPPSEGVGDLGVVVSGGGYPPGADASRVMRGEGGAGEFGGDADEGLGGGGPPPDSDDDM